MFKEWTKKIRKIFNRNHKKINLVFLILQTVWPYLVVLAAFFILIETYVYPGFLRKVILLNSQAFCMVVLGLGAILVLFRHRQMKKDILVSTVLLFNRLLIPAIIFIFFILQTQEKNHFPNYVFSTYHMHPLHFQTMVWFTLCLYAFELISTYRPYFYKLFILKKQKKMSFLFILAFFQIAWITLPTFFSLIRLQFSMFDTIIKYPHISYEEKMSMRLGSIYNYVAFVRDHTPQDAVIGVPPQRNPWLTTGNVGYVRYFLTPRTVISESENLDFSYDKADYLFLTHGEWAAPKEEDYGWPRATVSAELVWYYDLAENIATQSSQSTYDPTLPGERSKWGLIKVKKD